MTIPTLRLKNERSTRLKAGSPWVFSNELERVGKTEIEPGSIVRIANPRGHALGLFHFNPASLIAARKLSGNADRVLDAAWMRERIAKANGLRERLFDQPYYRLINAEADGLPGLIIDRFGDAFVVQCNTAGMDQHHDWIQQALEQLFEPDAILLRNTSFARHLEGLASEVRWLTGGRSEPVDVIEHGVSYRAALETGQKTGWYYDQRDNRRLFGSLAQGAQVLDLFSFSGGFGLQAARGGARRVLMIDGSKPAIELAREAAAAFAQDCMIDAEVSDAFDAAQRLANDKQRFDLISADPPPFARTKKDVPKALKAYQKLARLTANLTTEGGMLALSCCSHNIQTDAFLAECQSGIRQAGRAGKLMTIRGADLDHPVHPALPESGYLRFLLFQLD